MNYRSKTYSEDKILSLERQVLLWNLAIQGLNLYPNHEIEEYKTVLNQIKRYKDQAKRAINLIQTKETK